MIADNYHKVIERILVAADKAGRDPADIRLVVVTKGHPIESVKEVVDAGACNLGENYLEEAVPKIKTLAGYTEIVWHMVGHIQSRKARSVCENFHRVDSLDRIKLANRLERFAVELGLTIPVLLECNVSGEQSKYGFPAWDELRWLQLLPQIEKVVNLKSIKVCGLMTMPPYFSNAEEARPYFQKLAQLREFLEEHLPQTDWADLSMGMSNDFEVAIQEGSTMVRIGTAVLGERKS
ncbi:MAG: YggS family pyridoxal phosphate-dependent enzyme [Anaerolineales bacterium]